MKLEEKKQQKYNSNIIFTKHTDVTSTDTEKKSNLALIELKDIKWYKKIWKILTRFLTK